MKKIKIPIGGYPFQVSHSNLTKEDLHGDSSWDEKKIRINDQDDTLENIVTFGHEAFHMGLEVSGIKYLFESVPGLEEAVIRMHDHIVIPAIREYTKKIVDKPKKRR